MSQDADRPGTPERGVRGTELSSRQEVSGIATNLSSKICA